MSDKINPIKNDKYEAFKKMEAIKKIWEGNKQDTQASFVAHNHPNSVFGNGYTNNNTQYT